MTRREKEAEKEATAYYRDRRIKGRTACIAMKRCFGHVSARPGREPDALLLRRQDRMQSGNRKTTREAFA